MTTQIQQRKHVPSHEATAVARCHAHLTGLDPTWLERFDDAQLPTADRSTIVDLLQTAPDDFARGLLYGQLLARLELAQATGRPFA
ncbi:hypothetical protein [Rhodoferax sp.]|uniref:hypothetical protein n=1 Tax=Rhodoferax sp. TaxID=50421 RepID=UPI0027446B86|nr:hypothetical protein [Rhodoferax sp.]